MGIKFLGTDISLFDKLCEEEGYITITISCYKKIESKRKNDFGLTSYDSVVSSQFESKVRSSKDIFQFDGDAAKVYAVDLNKRQELVN
ncbi:MAG: hypothetical protein WA941_08205 [Nitrososphaeraceae archaeon]